DVSRPTQRQKSLEGGDRLGQTGAPQEQRHQKLRPPQGSTRRSSTGSPFARHTAPRPIGSSALGASVDRPMSRRVSSETGSGPFVPFHDACLAARRFDTLLDMEPISFETHPSRYRHWKLELDGELAFLWLDTQEDGGLRPGYLLKLNSYDLLVDIELADALQRLRFGHPEVRALVIGSKKEKVLSAGANIFMLGSSTHGFKVNFCKFTNETRLALEEMSAESGIRSVCAASGTTAGGGYELALACDRIILADDGNSAVSLPEVPLLGVLPGTGGLTRVVDKRKVRRDLADFFSATAEGVQGKRAVEWGLVDETVPRSTCFARVREVAQELARQSDRPLGEKG